MKAEPVKHFDPNDPHGFADLGEHHGHHINSVRTLVVVISTLVALTGLTVLASEVETYLVKEMGWALPEWVNVAVAMSIALVKGALVLMYFMGLRWENPLYTIVFLFCMFTFALFLGLTGMDLDNRGLVYEWKQVTIEPGGTGVNTRYPGATIYLKETKETVQLDAGGYSGPLALHLREQYIAKTGITEEVYWERWAEANHIHEAHAELPDANHSFPRFGVSGALDETAEEVSHSGKPAGGDGGH